MTAQQKYDRGVNQRFYKKHWKEIIKAARLYRKNNKKAIAKRRKQNYLKEKAEILHRNFLWRKKNSIQVHEQKRLYRLRKMGLSSQESLKAIIALRNHKGSCEICGRKTPGGMGGWLTDHNHKTKLFRGILCNKCNALLGFIQDNPKILKNALRYLGRAL